MMIKAPRSVPLGACASLYLLSTLSGCSGSSTVTPTEPSGGSSATSLGEAGGTGTQSGGNGSTATGQSSIGGSIQTGGSSAMSSPTGGSVAAGGSSTTSGSKATGGSVVTGGAKATGGTAATGGTKSTGGSMTAGGVSPTGGAAPIGGANPTGGAGTTGGTLAAGGTVSTTGTKATGGTTVATGGAAPTGGTKTAGGTTSAGGITSAGGTASTGGTTSAGGGASCSVVPVSPNASPQAKNLLCYLYSIYKNHILSGQQETNWNANPTDMSWYDTNIGKYPAVLGSDFMYRDGASCSSVTPSTTRAIAYWNAGGIIMFRYHMGMPGSGLTCTADCYQGDNCAQPNTKPSGNYFANLIASGTVENTSLNSKLDYMAVQLKAMQDANVPVILAVYHEVQSNGWFWWAETTSGPAFVNLWTYTFNYLTKTKGLTNIIWLIPFSGSPSTAFYPGKAYADIGGPDQYTQPSNLLTFSASENWNASTSVLGTSMPIAMHETGTAIQPDSAFPSTPWLLWNVWSTYENTPASGFTFNTVASLKQAYASQYTITRDEIPNLK